MSTSSRSCPHCHALLGDGGSDGVICPICKGTLEASAATTTVSHRGRIRRLLTACGALLAMASAGALVAHQLMFPSPQGAARNAPSPPPPPAPAPNRPAEPTLEQAVLSRFVVTRIKPSQPGQPDRVLVGLRRPRYRQPA